MKIANPKWIITKNRLDTLYSVLSYNFIVIDLHRTNTLGGAVDLIWIYIYLYLSKMRKEKLQTEQEKFPIKCHKLYDNQ